jgi:transposase
MIPMNRQELETRRLAAEKLLRAGVRSAEIAREFRVSRVTVARWRHLMHSPGGLKARPATGRPFRLPPGVVRRIWAKQPAWTGKSFAAAIQAETGVSYARDYCCLFLRRLRGRVGAGRPPMTRKAGA